MGPHTASIDDAAFEAVIHRLGDPTDTCGDLFVWDATTGMWCGSHNAGDVLAQHVKTHWVPLVGECCLRSCATYTAGYHGPV